MENITKYLIKSTVKKSEVKAWEETVMLPTYEIGKEEKNPVFIEKRVYQGSSGVMKRRRKLIVLFSWKTNI